MGIIRLILFVFHGIIVLLLFGALANSIVPPKVFPWFNFLSLAFPILFILHLILCFFGIFTWKKRAFVFLFFTVFFFNGARRWVNYSGLNNEKSDFKVLTYNIRSGREGREELSQFLKEQNVDVVFLQESGPPGAYKIDKANWATTQKIVTTFTNHKIINEKELIDDGRTSFAKLTDIEINGKVVRFVNVYLEPYRLVKEMVKPTGDVDENEEKAKTLVKQMIPVFKAHQEEVESIISGIGNSPYPVVIVGDFNSVPNSYEYYKMTKNYNDVFLEVGRGLGTTFHDYKLPIRIDYIYASESLEPISYNVNRNAHHSDHFPVTAEFSFKK